MIEPRTYEEFAEDIVSDGRSFKHIIAVIRNTRWKAYEKEIRKIVLKFRKFYKKKS